MESRFQAGDISQLEARDGGDRRRARAAGGRARARSTLLFAPTNCARAGSGARGRRDAASLARRPRSSRCARHAGAARRRPRPRVPTCAPRSWRSKRRRRVWDGSGHASWRSPRCSTRTAQGPKASRWAPASTSGCRSSTATRADIARAQAELAARERPVSSRRASASRPSCATAAAQYDQRARRPRPSGATTVLTPLEEQVQAADRAFADGRGLLPVRLEMKRRLTDARLRTREAEADIARALARTRAGDRPAVRHHGRRARWWLLESSIVDAVCLAVAGCGARGGRRPRRRPSPPP